MRTLKVLVVSFASILMSVGIPTHVMATQRPRPLDARTAIASVVEAGRTVSRPLVLPWHANMVNLSWVGSDPDAAGVEVAIRAFERGDWTEWFDLHVEPDESPDLEELRRATDRIVTLPQWVGRARRIEVEVSLEPDAAPIRDLRLESQNTVGNAFDTPAPLAIVRAIGRFLTAPRVVGTPAEAMTKRPAIISRAVWNDGRCPRDGTPVRYADDVHASIVHHTVNSNSYAKSQSAALVLGICRYHTRNLDYSDIGYNFLIDRYGQIFEGRAGGVRNTVIGAHAGGFNTGTSGVALIGNFTSSRPTSAMLTSLKRLLAWKLDIHKIPPIGRVRMVSAGGSKYAKGKVVYLNRISGHRDASSTACPGMSTYDLLPSIRTGVNGIGHPKIYLPRPSHRDRVDFTGHDADGPFSVRPLFSRTVRWRFSVTNSGGQEVFARTGRSTRMTVAWDGRGPGSLLVPSGRYRWLITARDGDGRVARGAVGSLMVDADFLPPFFDDDGYAQESYINTLMEDDILTGCGIQVFCPTRHVTRAQLAVWLVRALGLTDPVLQDFFSDDDGMAAEDAINMLAARGIASACDADRYCPNDPVTRADMAVFLVKAFDVPASETDYFTDDDGSFAEDAINALAEAGKVSGCGAGRYCPNLAVTRGSTAVFLTRMLPPSP